MKKRGKTGEFKIITKEEFKILEEFRKKLEAIAEQIEEAGDYMQYLYGFEAKIPVMTLRIITLLYRALIGEAAHTGEINKQTKNAIKHLVKELYHFTDDPRVQTVLALIYGDLEIDGLPISTYRKHFKVFQYMLDQVSETGLELKDVIDLWDTYTTATQFYIDPIHLEKMKKDLREVVVKLMVPARRLVKTDIERKYYVNEPIKLIEKIKTARDHLELHRYLEESRDLILALYELQKTETKIPQKQKDMRKELIERLEGQYKILAILYALGATPRSELYIPTVRILHETPWGQSKTKTLLKQLQNQKLVERKFFPTPRGPATSAYKLTEEGYNLIKEKEKEIFPIEK